MNVNECLIMKDAIPPNYSNSAILISDAVINIFILKLYKFYLNLATS